MATRKIPISESGPAAWNDYALIMMAVEFGWKQYEKGFNLEAAMANARKVYGDKGKPQC